MRILICLVFLLALPTVSQAQDTSDPRAWTEQFLRTLVDDGAKEANQMLLNDSQLGDQRPDMITGIRENMQTSEESHGKATGYELLTEKKWGDSVVVFIAIVKREKTAVFWRLVFYRYRSSWNLVHFTLLDSFGDIDSFWLL